MSSRGVSWIEQYTPQLLDLVWRFKRSRGEHGTTNPWGRVLVITGAGCSASAGIPTAWQIAQESVVDLSLIYGLVKDEGELGDTPYVRAATAVERLVKDGSLPKNFSASQGASEPWSELYEHLFTHIYTSPMEQKRVIERALAREKGLNWAHACLGELMRHRYVHTVLTVNFDLLALEGAVRAGMIPAIADGFEGLSRVDGAPAHPQLVYLHGTRHNYTLRNSTHHVNAGAMNSAVIRAVEDLVRGSECILVVGYSAADNGLSEILRKSLNDYGPRLVWTAYDSEEERLSANARAICESSKATLLLGVDADGLFRELLRKLRLGAPLWIKDPLRVLLEGSDRLLYGDDFVVRSVVERLQEKITFYHDRMKAELNESVVDQLGLAAELRLAGQELEAITILRQIHSTTSKTPEVMLALGDALIAAGKVRAEPALLEEAVKVLKEYLKIVRRKIGKKAWAQAKTMLGYALVNLGDIKEGTELLREAASAIRGALDVYTREGQPLEWAKAQNDLGSALRTLADLEPGTKRLKEAIAAFRLALMVRTREQCPLDWATTQHNLGEALACLGDREEGTARLEEAVSALREALEVRTQAGVPFAWARTQHYLGSALRSLGMREEGTVHLEEAVGALREALKVRTREQVPLYWARTQNKLGRALATLGEREGGTARLEEAVMAYRTALEVRSKEGSIRDRVITQCNLADALVSLEREEGTARLQEAMAVARDVLELPAPISTEYASRAQSVLTRAQNAIYVRQAKII